MSGFHDLQFYDYLRILTAIMAAIAAYRLGRQVRTRYVDYTRRLGEWVWIIFMALFLFFAGSIEAIAANTSYRYGTFLSLTITAAAIRAYRPGGIIKEVNE